MADTITNILAMLHTTVAYQTAALQLMVGHANFVAKQLDLKEPLPIIIPADTNNWSVAPPPEGIGGFIATSNYFFEFQHGQLSSVHKRDWLHKVSPPVNNILDLANRLSLINTNSAYQLATQWLTSISINVAEMERTSPPIIFQEFDKIPFFKIGWGESPFERQLPEKLKKLEMSRSFYPNSELNLVYMEILGTTKELLELDVQDKSLFKNTPLQITNVAELLGPLPPKHYYVQELLGGKNAYQTVALPDKVEAWLLNGNDAGEGVNPLANRTSSVKLKPVTAKKFSDVLANFDSYNWRPRGKYCSINYGVRLRFTRGRDVVEFLLCYSCYDLQASHNGHIGHCDFSPSASKLIEAIQSVFPNDKIIKELN